MFPINQVNHDADFDLRDPQLGINVHLFGLLQLLDRIQFHRVQLGPIHIPLLAQTTSRSIHHVQIRTADVCFQSLQLSQG